MSDLISRQAAIDEIEERKNANGYSNVAVISELHRLEGYIMRLPSAQPEKRTEERAETHACDLISRQDAIDAINAYLGLSAVSRTIQNMTSIQEILENLPSAESEQSIAEWQKDFREYINMLNIPRDDYNGIMEYIDDLPSAEIERDIPIKPNETIDTAWGIPLKQAVCPKCDCYLGHVAFLGDYKGKRITYCETCGQAIDWEGWDFDE